jgi:hypothetical protein
MMLYFPFIPNYVRLFTKNISLCCTGSPAVLDDEEGILGNVLESLASQRARTMGGFTATQAQLLQSTSAASESSFHGFSSPGPSSGSAPAASGSQRPPVPDPDPAFRAYQVRPEAQPDRPAAPNAPHLVPAVMRVVQQQAANVDAGLQDGGGGHGALQAAPVAPRLRRLRRPAMAPTSTC